MTIEAPDPAIGAIVLAGGRSSRFGRDKLAEPVHGMPLLERPTVIVRGVATVVVVVLAPGDTRSLASDVVRIHDDAAFEGPLAGAAAGLRALPASIDRALLVGGDMPELEPGVLRLLLSALADTTLDAACLHDGERRRPLPSAVRVAPAAAAATDLVRSGERRLRALFDHLSTRAIELAAWQPFDAAGATLRDIDLPTDL